MIRTAAFLRNVPVLIGLSDELRERLAAQVRDVRVLAGEWLMREGEPADSMFIVRSGRLEVIDEGPPEALIRVLRRGDVLGELALLRRGTRSASVRARRDADLLELGRAEFESLIEQAPSFALGLTRAMGAQLAASRSPVVAATPPRTIAVVGLDPGAPTAEVAELLAGGLSRYGTVTRLHDGELVAIDQAERDADRVILRGGNDPRQPWTELCVREADLVMAVTTGAPDLGWLERATALHGCELLVLGPAVADGVLDRIQPLQLQVVRDPSRRPQALELTGRRLAARALGVVLSGGGARAMAHLGVLEELRRSGLHLDRVAGVSLGALVAASVAAGFSTEGIYDTFERSFVQTNPTDDFVPPAYSLIRGAKTRRLLGEAFGDRRIEELPLRFFCVSCDLIGREAVLHTVGPVVDAVYPSLAIPGVFPPVPSNGRLLVDGGVLDNLPVATMARAGEGPVIAVDVTGHMGTFRPAQRPAMARLGGPLRRTLTGSEEVVPRLAETMLRTVTVGSSDTVAAARLHADLVITPHADRIALMDWKAFPRVVELGRQAARAALGADPGLIDRLRG
jgi:predicted acylesterase/phospholipase RssA/CRP-like cAMP-binding protein